MTRPRAETHVSASPRDGVRFSGMSGIPSVDDPDLRRADSRTNCGRRAMIARTRLEIGDERVFPCFGRETRNFRRGSLVSAGHRGFRVPAVSGKQDCQGCRLQHGPTSLAAGEKEVSDAAAVDTCSSVNKGMALGAIATVPFEAA